jgi:hypothetical protein
MAMSCQKQEAFGQDLLKNHYILGWKAMVEDSRFLATFFNFEIRGLANRFLMEIVTHVKDGTRAL